MSAPHPSVGAPGDPYRYGVYLRPDPATCWAVTTVTTQLRAQYGLRSAGAFPPHATLVGSQHVPGREDELVAAVTAGLVGRTAFTVHNSGARGQGVGVVYDVHHLDDTRTTNAAFVDLAEAVHDAVAPLVTGAPNPELHQFDRRTWRAHLSLASHDLYARPDLAREVAEYIDGLPVPHPGTFAGDTVALYRTRSEDWTGRWWQTLSWDHVHTWRLPTAPDHAGAGADHAGAGADHAGAGADHAGATSTDTCIVEVSASVNTIPRSGGTSA